MKVYVVIRRPARGSIHKRNPVVAVVFDHNEARRIVKEKTNATSKGMGVSYSYHGIKTGYGIETK